MTHKCVGLIVCSYVRNDTCVWAGQARMLHNHPVAELQAREENVSVIDEVCVCMCACVCVCVRV